MALMVLLCGAASADAAEPQRVFGDYCAEPDKVMEVAPPPVIHANYSSFRGISLSSRPDNVRWQAQSLGFDTFTSYFVGGDNVSAVKIGIDGNEVGRADFDRAGTMIRLALKQRFFSDTRFRRGWLRASSGPSTPKR
jgi:hypothetical protein